MFSSFGYTEMLLLGVIALMLFGSRLPEVARNFGRGYREVRRKLDEVQREFRDWDKPEPNPPSRPQSLIGQTDDVQRYQPAAPRFVPPTDNDD
ncbi:MAG: twin-arginine translocase TatA/TatE family subunit [Pirellulaceae bacterium]|nr:twin-arginine translocase TatA/TatE family subunit [Pirellulaceae bacterium]